MPTYIVRTQEFGDIRKQEENIAAARKWAKRAFPRGVVCVMREYRHSWCSDCGCSPCCCMVRRDV